MTEEELEKEIKILRKVAEDWKESCHKAWKENAELNKKLREKILNEKCFVCRYNTVGQDEYIHILEEQNKDLATQIEKMKCCNNCKHKNLNWNFRPICTFDKSEVRNIENPVSCKCDKWELEE